MGNFGLLFGVAVLIVLTAQAIKPSEASLSAAGSWYARTLKRLKDSTPGAITQVAQLISAASTNHALEQRHRPVADPLHLPASSMLLPENLTLEGDSLSAKLHDTSSPMSLPSTAEVLHELTMADNGRSQNNYLLRLLERTQQPLAGLTSSSSNAASDSGSATTMEPTAVASCSFCCQKRNHYMLGVVRTDDAGHRCWSPQAFIRVASCSGACQSLEYSQHVSPLGSVKTGNWQHVSKQYKSASPQHLLGDAMSSRTCQPTVSETVRLELVCDVENVGDDMRFYEYEQAVQCHCTACAKSKRSVACRSVADVFDNDFGELSFANDQE